MFLDMIASCAQGKVASPAGTVTWLADWKAGQDCDPTTTEGALHLLRSLVVSLLEATEQEVTRLIKVEGVDAFTARNRSQWHLAR